MPGAPRSMLGLAVGVAVAVGGCVLPEYEYNPSADNLYGGTGGIPPARTSFELVNPEGWYGGDAARSEDDVLGLQGGVYRYGDGVEVPATFPGSSCGAAGCCIQGNTVLDPAYAAWGAALSFELHGNGPSRPANPYTGPATCFDLVLEGTSGGAELRIQMRSTAPDDPAFPEPPLLSIGTLEGSRSRRVCLGDAHCAEWSQPPVKDPPTCTETGDWYTFEVMVVGAEVAGSFDFCVTSLVAVVE